MKGNKKIILILSVFLIQYNFCVGGECVKAKIISIDSTTFSRFTVYKMQHHKKIMTAILYHNSVDSSNEILLGRCYKFELDTLREIQMNDGNFFSLERGFSIYDEKNKSFITLFKKDEISYKIISVK